MQTYKPVKTAGDLMSFQQSYDAAHAAGMQAGQTVGVTPMVVQQHANMANDNSPVVQQWVVDEGVCGFAWVVIRPATSSFARWLKKNNLGDKHYYGGIAVWVREFGQSMTRKEAYAQEFATVLRSRGFDAHAESRMD